MRGTLPHTANGFAQTAADQHLRERRDEADGATDDPTMLKCEGNVTIAEDDPGGDPYNRTGRFHRLVR
jgi:hypothetical protein